MPDQQEKTSAQAVERVEKWNACHPIGTPVTRYAFINPLRGGADTKTRSAAWVIGAHAPVVLVEGVPGGVHLDSIVPIEPSASIPTRDELADLEKLEAGTRPQGIENHYPLTGRVEFALEDGHRMQGDSRYVPRIFRGPR